MDKETLQQYFEEFDQGVDYNDRMTAILLSNGCREPSNEREKAMVEYLKTHSTMRATPMEIAQAVAPDPITDIEKEMKKLPISTRLENIRDLVEPTQCIPNFTLAIFEDIRLACQLVDKVLKDAEKTELATEWKSLYQVGNIVSKHLQGYEDFIQFLYYWGLSTPVGLYRQDSCQWYGISITLEPKQGKFPTIEFFDLVHLLILGDGSMEHAYSLQLAAE